MKDETIKKVLVIGSGPIIIGQAAEFDYAGTQACRALREEGIQVVLVNSNPATIMTDGEIADKVYIEPLKAEIIEKIIAIERPDSLLPTMGGQTGLNLAVELSEKGILEKYSVRLLGTNLDAIITAEDRQAFKDAMESIGEPCVSSKVVKSTHEAILFAREIGFPLIVRPAYTLGGSGGGIAENEEILRGICENGLRLSRVGQVLVERCISGWKEIEYEVIRDKKGNVITICNMENIDPVGVHTGDSMVVAPAQTLADREHQMLRTSALKIITRLGIEGGCNVQFALNPTSFEYGVIEVNPRVSRSSALASKATGYPIAKVATKIAIGYGLDEIRNSVTGKTFACFEPALDYVVMKMPRLPFDKFARAKRTLGTQMKATGEVMAIGNSFESAFMKAIRGLGQGAFSLSNSKYKETSTKKIIKKLYDIDDERIFTIAEAIRRNISLEIINEITKIDIFFLNKIKNLIKMEENLERTSIGNLTRNLLLNCKKMGFLDLTIAGFVGVSEEDIKDLRSKYGIRASFKMVDTCAGEFQAETPYYYSTYDEANESAASNKKKVLVIGSGPIRIGQGIEFDYCSVHSVWALKNEGYETIIVNNNPETVSTDFDTGDKLYFEPLVKEDIQNIVEIEKPDFAIVQFGGQTAINLAKDIVKMGVKIMGSGLESIDAAENREKFDGILEKLKIGRPDGRMVFTSEQAVKAAEEIGYPVLIRPSYVLGGQGMEIAQNGEDVKEFMHIIQKTIQEHPILVDKYISGTEIEVDAICDGKDILIPGIMEHLEKAGVHSGDSVSIYPSVNLGAGIKKKIEEYTKALAMEMNVIGLINIQFVLDDESQELYVIEVNPRSSRTIPFISKATGIPVVELAIKVMNDKKLKNLAYGTGISAEVDLFSVKVPVFSFEKLQDVDTGLGPEMKSTGEAMGTGKTIGEALYKGFIAADITMPKEHSGILVTVKDCDKPKIEVIAGKISQLPYKLWATAKTSEYLNERNIPANRINKIGEDKPNIFDLMQTGEISMIINTPTKGRVPERDGVRIRRKAVEMSVPCFTSLDTALAVINCLEEKRNINGIDVYEISQVGTIKEDVNKNEDVNKKEGGSYV